MSQPSPQPPRGTRSAVLTGVVVGALVFVVGLGGILTWQASNHGRDNSATLAPSPTAQGRPHRGPMPASDPSLASFYHQRLHWRSCGANQCARLKVPLDYAHPGRRTLELAVLRVPAGVPSQKVGDLVINNGGPGGSPVDYAQAAPTQFGARLLDRFAIVGMDPRGVGQSDPLECVGTHDLDEMLASDPDPDTEKERNRMDALIHRFGEGCLAHDAGLARHMSTVEVAKDTDILRAALGDPKLDYLGLSYGTFLGATYANLFPHHVGRMVLDGAIDPKLSNLQLSLAQAHGFEVALRAYVKSCVDQGGCILGNSVDQGTRRVRTLLDQIEAHPLPTGTSRPLTAGLAMMGVWMPLYVKSWWPELTVGLKQAIVDHRGSTLLQMADLYASRGPRSYTDNSMNALYDVNCLDHDDYIPTSQVPQYFKRFEKVSPTFGKAFAFSLSTCADWPVKSHKHTVALHAKGAPPILVVGTTRDPATPLAWARGLASELDSGVLVTRNGDGHTAYHQGNQCIDSTVEDFLISDKVPPNGKAC
ncbi:alpha/beta hydrolase [Nocardioides terrisoli]|uniref:alpha/beta hydrolase n=1 Tax=Nocardioides terrisoli TaxID=3388267 RepID=UPI00287BBBFD|nr:alpha/beta hydrolase [Nocardioides marmorisolisilvae]